MSFDRDSLIRAINQHGSVTRVVIADVEGSSPREVGASMLVWRDGQSGTIGGGTLEFDAAQAARKGPFFRRIPLGPALGQCCGGAVTLVAERFDASNVDTLAHDHVLRRVHGNSEQPLGFARALAAYRNAGTPIAPNYSNGWFIEPITKPSRSIWIWGAGHVGRALVDVLAPLPELGLTWIDTAANRFPANCPENVDQLIAQNPAELVRHAPGDSEHLILTYSHALDLELCHRLLSHGFARAGLIGSKTKWARFRSRLRNLGHSDDQITRIQCPIGQKDLGKHPQAIAVGVAAEILNARQTKENEIRGVG
jgi:xanthine dehydrogenase accessory factor